MGEVLKFQLKETSETQTIQREVEAEIFIFPGVRIERRGFSLADRPYTASTSKQSSYMTRKKIKE